MADRIAGASQAVAHGSECMVVSHPVDQGERVMGTVVLLPSAAAQHVCHDEQLTVWSSDLIDALSLGDFLRPDLDYQQVLALHDALRHEVTNIVGMAFEHGDVRAILKPVP